MQSYLVLCCFAGCIRSRFSESQMLHCDSSNCLCLSICQTGTDNLPLDCTLFFSVCHAVYWKPKVWMGANNRNSWEEAPEASHKSRGKFDMIASLNLNPAQTEYLAAALCATLHSHALWYTEGYACPNLIFSPIRNGLCNDESCHVVDIQTVIFLILL